MKFITVILLIFLSGCSSLYQFENTTGKMTHINKIYCNGEGFESFYDLGNYIAFTCTNGRDFYIRH